MKNPFGRRQSSPSLESLTQQQEQLIDDNKEASTSSNIPVAAQPSPSGLVGNTKSTSANGHHAAPVPVQEQYGFHSTCLQIKDPIRSLKFYDEVFGMEVVKETESDDYSMYFLGFKLPPNLDVIQFGNRVGLLQLVHVHGTEDDDSFRIKTGHPGFSHFSVSVPDVDKARVRMEGMGVEIVEDGTNARGFAAVADPDGYHIQLISQSVGEDDGLRAELERLMNTPGMGLNPIAASDHHDQASFDALRFAKGGSPISPRSPASPNML